jgi:hypothetical protein
MPGLFPHQAAPGTVPSGQLEAVEVLHAACRRWAEPVPVHLPYIDLTFAFGFATLGDAARAQRLLGEGVAALDAAPVPTGGFRDAVGTAAVVIRRFLAEVFRSRVEQALAGDPHVGPLSGRVLAAWDEIVRQGRTGQAPNPYFLVEHAVNVYRLVSRVLEPVDRPDPYRPLSGPRDDTRRQLEEAEALRDPTALAGQLGRVVRGVVSGGDPGPDQLHALRDALSLSVRAGKMSAIESLDLILPILSGAVGEAVVSGQDRGPVIWRVSQLVEQGLFVAGWTGRADLTLAWAGRFVELAERFPAEPRHDLIRWAGPQALRSLQTLGLSDGIDATFARLRALVPVSLPGADPHVAGSLLGARLVLAAGLLTLGSVAEAAPALDQARQELLGRDSLKLLSKDYTELAGAYVFALGQWHPEPALSRMTALFPEMPPGRITNTWTTAPYFSRSHLILSEEAVASVCRVLLKPPHP